jgi:hypothetical protein
MIYQHIKSRIGSPNSGNPKPIIRTSSITKEITEIHEIMHIKADNISVREDDGGTLDVGKFGIPNAPKVLYSSGRLSNMPKIVLNGSEEDHDEKGIRIDSGKIENITKVIKENCMSTTHNNLHNRISFSVIPKRSSRFSFFGTLENSFRRKSKNKNEHSRFKRDAKAARFLAILVLVFLACWAPYTITTIVISFCGNECVNTSFYESMNWMLWSKSAINPFLYAINSSRYRFHFKKYIFCCKNQVYPNNTETTCQTAG